jgi:hypothetical protein
VRDSLPLMGKTDPNNFELHHWASRSGPIGRSLNRLFGSTHDYKKARPLVGRSGLLCSLEEINTRSQGQTSIAC